MAAAPRCRCAPSLDYIGDILLLKLHNNVVVDATDEDGRKGLKYLDNLF